LTIWHFILCSVWNMARCGDEAIYWLDMKRNCLATVLRIDLACQLLY
jgi:hypothetical protein